MSRKLLLTLPVLLLFAVAGLWYYVNHRTRALVDAHLERMVSSGQYQDITYEHLRVGLTGKVTLRDLRFVLPEGQELTLADVQVSNLDYANEIPEHMNLSARGIRLPADQALLGTSENELLARYVESQAENGVLPLEIDYLHRYTPDDAFRLDSDLRMALPESFTLQVNSSSSQLDLATYNDVATRDPDPARAQLQMMQQLGEAEIDSAQIRLQDQGLLEGLLALSGEQSGVSAEDMRRLLITQAHNMHLFVPEAAQALAQDAGTQLATFLEGGRTLSTSIAPPNLNRFQDLQQDIMGAAFSGNFNHIADTLGLEIITQ